jgi:hypothetical protein
VKEGPYGEIVSQPIGVFLKSLFQRLPVFFSRFGWQTAPQFGGQSFEYDFPPAVVPAVNSGNADDLHLSDHGGFMSQVQEANRSTALVHIWKHEFTAFINEIRINYLGR